jgi:hypothetical protein
MYEGLERNDLSMSVHANVVVTPLTLNAHAIVWR